MFSNNEQFQVLCREIKAAGYELRCFWSAQTSESVEYDDLAMFTLVGTPRPKVSTFIVRDYGPRDGYALYLESETNRQADDLAAIIGGPVWRTLMPGSAAAESEARRDEQQD